MQFAEAKNILYQIITKGGAISDCAKLLKHDNKRILQFLIECSQLTTSTHMQNHWGNSLTQQIKQFALTHQINKKSFPPASSKK